MHEAATGNGVIKPDGHPLTGADIALSAQLPRLAGQLGVPVSRFHDFRHSHATVLPGAVGVRPTVAS